MPAGGARSMLASVSSVYSGRRGSGSIKTRAAARTGSVHPGEGRLGEKGGVRRRFPRRGCRRGGGGCGAAGVEEAGVRPGRLGRSRGRWLSPSSQERGIRLFPCKLRHTGTLPQEEVTVHDRTE